MDHVIVWAGWLGGIAIGLYMLGQFLLTGLALGVSTGYGNVCAIASKDRYFCEGVFEDPFNWRLFFVLGLPLGGLLGVLTSPGAAWEPSLTLGPLYDGVFPDALWAKALLLTVGGVLIGYGSRMAGGCTSGHSITGLSLLNPPSLVASIGFFAGGIVAVQILFNVIG